MADSDTYMTDAACSRKWCVSSRLQITSSFPFARSVNNAFNL